jgi:uncharacterized protein YggE
MFFALSVSAAGGEKTRLITVRGDSEIKVKPDRVILTLGIETDDMVLMEAKEESDQKSRNLLDTLGRFKVEKKDIQSDFINIEPRYEWEHKQKEFLGYWVRKTYVVTLRDIDKFEELLSAILEAGVEHVHGISFRTSKLKKHRNLARDKAILAARQKAIDLAAALGKKIGEPYSIDENHTYWHSGYDRYWGRARGSMYSQTVVEAPSGGGSGGTFEPGKISVTARVTVRFELE